MRLTVFNFEEQLAKSHSLNGSPLEDVIMSLLPGCALVVKTDLAMDKTGVDYIATLGGGATVRIDTKKREVGCSKYWKDGVPELALEIWSVRPTTSRAGRCGWTLDESKQTDYTLHVFHGNDTDAAFLLPFQLLRVAFKKNGASWLRKYRTAIQPNHGYESECIFMPASVVLEAIKEAMTLQPKSASKVAA